MKRVAILQSNYIPWKGYFDLINMVDEFVLLDEVQFTKNDWRNRNRIKTSQGVKWLTIPVSHTLSQRIDETRCTNQLWRKKHWASISQSYARAAHFKEFGPCFEPLYFQSEDVMLSRINHAFITTINGILGIETKISWSSDYRIIAGKTERLVDICRKTGATEYLSGPAAKDYLNEGAFKDAGIGVKWMDYSGYREYQQAFPPFNHFVSVLDLIFNEGPNASRFLKSKEPS